MMADFELGQRVRITHQIIRTNRSDANGYYAMSGGEIVAEPSSQFTGNYVNPSWDRVLVRQSLKSPIEGILVGYTFRVTGHYHASGWDSESPGWLEATKYHKVWLVASHLRWQQPTLVLEGDLVII